MLKNKHIIGIIPVMQSNYYNYFVNSIVLQILPFLDGTHSLSGRECAARSN